MNKIKILHLVNEFGYDGSSEVVFNLCNLFSDDLHEIYLVSLSHRIPLVKSKDWPRNVRVHSFNYYFEDDYSLRKYFLLYFKPRITRQRGRDIIDCINSIGPDILHCHLQPRELVIATLAHRHEKTQLLFTDHLVRIKRGQYSTINTRLLAWIYRKIYSRFHVVAVAKSVFNCHKDFKLVSQEKIHALIENKIETSKFTPGVKSLSSSIKVVYVARLEKRKGQDILLKAWSELMSIENVELILVGSGETESELKTMVNFLQPKRPVIFTGVVENVLPYLQSAHIAVFPSLHEGLPLALLEKMSCGLPVIASDIDEFKEIITDMENGILFKTGNPDDLRCKLEMLISDRALRERIGIRARKFVVKHYDIHRLKQEYDQVYKKLLKIQH